MIKLGRRMFLKGTGGVLVYLPMLEAFRSSVASAADADPKRFICMYIPNGTYMVGNDGANWFPAATGNLNPANLPVTFQPFAAYAADFSILRGINNRAVGEGYNNLQSSSGGRAGGQHACGISAFLTCAPPVDNSARCTIASDSFDQIAAQKFGVNGGKALNLCGGAIGNQVADLTAFHYGEFLSYRSGAAVPPFRNPVLLFNQMFASIEPGSPTPTGPLPALGRNKSILDYATGDLRTLQGRLGSSDKQRLEEYLTHLRAVEQQVKALPPPATGPACVGIPKPAATLDNEDYYGNRVDFPERLQAFTDMMVLAFKCDRVRSVTLAFDTEAASRRFKGKIPDALIYQNATMTEDESHIGMSHWTDDPAKPAKCVSRDRFYLSYFFKVIDALKKVNDPSGSPMLDNTAILTGHGMVDGSHSGGSFGFPLALGGGKNFLNPGKLHDNPRTDMSDLLFTLNSKMGMGLANFRGSTRLLNI